MQWIADEPTLHRLSTLLSGYSGADIEKIVDDAASEAFRRSLVAQTEAPITFDLIIQRISGWPRSVDDQSLQRYREWGQSRRGVTGRPPETLG
jgi:SpoVK/Ycf46/Vps4 family AAA+-type ATPase